MYSYVRAVGIPTFVAREAPAFLMAFLIAELFYKFRSFTLETLAFLATWYALSWVQSAIVGRGDRGWRGGREGRGDREHHRGRE
jgi:hypothetical protein